MNDVLNSSYFLNNIATVSEPNSTYNGTGIFTVNVNDLHDPNYVIPIREVVIQQPVDPSPVTETIRRLLENGDNLSSASTLLPDTSNLTDVTNGISYQIRVCGVPGFCESSVFETCRNISIGSCSGCNQVGSVLFAFLVTVLALAIVCGNALIILVALYNHRRDISSKTDAYKASLAVADITTGFQILAVTLPNFAWTLNSTPTEIRIEQDALKNSLQAFIGGTFYLFGYTASLYHLVLLGFQRLYAIKWPIRYKTQSRKNVYVGIILTWTLAMISATVPTWFPQHFEFDYYHTTFLYFPSLIPSGDQSYGPAFALLCLLLIVPYLVMTLNSMLTAVFVRHQLKRSQHIRSHSRVKSQSKQEIAAFKTVSLMQIGFTVTLVPLGVIVGLTYAGYFVCNNISTPYMVCFYLCMTNSLVNVLVYSARDKKFRQSAKDILSPCLRACCCCSARNEELNSNTQSNHTRPRTKQETTLA